MKKAREQWELVWGSMLSSEVVQWYRREHCPEA